MASKVRYRKRPSGYLLNIIFPVWLLVWWPSWLWLLLIPGNYLIDRLVLRWSLRGDENRDVICRSQTWKVCLAGFASDLVGACMLFAMMILSDVLGGMSEGTEWLCSVSASLSVNPFGHPLAFLLACLGIAVAGRCIYLLDARILQKAGIEDEKACRSAKLLAVITAPYLFLLPVELIWPSL